MSKDEKALWGIHAGRAGEAGDLFIKHNVIALGWLEMGNLKILPPNREGIKKKLQEAFPGKKEGYYPIASGQLYRFAHEAKIGDLVVYPYRFEQKIYIGEIIGEYKHNPTLDPHFPQQRAVKWLNSFPRAKFSQGALYEIGSAMSFFKIKNFADEFLTALSGKKIGKPVEKDESIAYVAADIEQNTRDFIFKRLTQELKGHSLAEFVAHLLEKMGYRIRLAPEGPDGGIDIMAHKDELGFEPPIIKVQVKSSDGNIGDPIISQLYGKVEKPEYGMVVALGSFTNQAKNFARNKSNLRLIDGDELISLILQHYEKFDSRYKGLLPLRKVYVPEPLEED
jgi:restriction system protein